MICDTRKDKHSLQAKALKELKKNIGGGNNGSGDNKNEVFKPGDKVDQNNTNHKPKVAKDSLPLKHQSKVVTNTTETRSKLDQFINNKSVNVVKNNTSHVHNRSNFQSKLDKFSREEFDKHEEKQIHDNLDRN